MRCDTSQTQRKMRAVPVVISLLVLLDGALAQAESAPKTLSSVFSGFLRYNLSRVEDPEKLVQENKTMQVQTDVCSQITSLVPWYEERKNSSTCTIKIDRQRTHVNYTILITDDFLRKYDPSCVTYDILLANQVRLSPAFANQYYLSDIQLETCRIPEHFLPNTDLLEIQLETRNRAQPAGPSPTGTGSTTIRVEGLLYKSASWLRWDEVRSFADVTKEVGENVKNQFVRFLRLHPNNGTYINTERRNIYREPTDPTLTRMEAQITFNNSMLVANGINYTCPPFKELVNASLNSKFYFNRTIYLWREVRILG
ncbi:hypothetical protein AHF37_10586 [Paragonimus kellicotti]|nr:hypothetical protein AHF37_10586 [Paragonimus kellicotti]